MKHLLHHFKTLTKHPQNAEELKGFILQLAVQGKLTENWRQENTNVESASELLNQIQIEKDKIIASKEIKKEKLEEIDDSTEFPFTIPNSWKLVRLGNTMSIIRGVSFKKHEVSEEKTQGTIGVLRGQNMVNSEINKNKLIYLSREKVKNTQIIGKGDIAITLSSGSDKLVGKIGLSSFDEEFTIGAFYGKLKVFEDDTKFYILNYLDSPLYKNQLKGAFRGIGINNLSNSKVKNLIIPLPPREEQKAIVAIVNELFKEVEQLEEQTKTRIQHKEDFVTSALQRLSQVENVNQEWQFLQTHFTEFFTEKESIKQLRDTILQLAVQGKLTSKWRSRHPELISGTHHASELLKRIQTEKQQLIAQKKIKKEKPLSPIEDDEKPYDLPEGWVWCRIGQFTTIKGGKRLPKGEKLTREDTGFIYLRVTDMKNGTIDDSDLHYLTKTARKEIKNYTISKNELYLTIVGATIGKLGNIPEKFDGVNLTENAVKIFSYLMNKDFVQTCLNSNLIQNQFIDKTLQVGVPKLAMHRINKTLFPLPPLEEQKIIVQLVNTLMALCDSLEEQIENSQTQIEQLMQSCLKEVFEVQ